MQFSDATQLCLTPYLATLDVKCGNMSGRSLTSQCYKEWSILSSYCLRAIIAHCDVFVLGVVHIYHHIKL